MTDDDHPSIEAVDPPFKPLDSEEVEMVRWFVQDKEFSRLTEGTGERNALCLTSGERAEWCLKECSHSEALEDCTRLPAIPDGVTYATPFKWCVLVEYAHADTTTTANLSCLWKLGACEDAKERGLTGAVDPNDTDSILVFDRD
jgi:hypothetical protein